MASYSFLSGSRGSRGPRGSFTDATAIACAINIFGQNSIYRLEPANGLCLNPNAAQINVPGELPPRLSSISEQRQDSFADSEVWILNRLWSIPKLQPMPHHLLGPYAADKARQHHWLVQRLGY